MSKGFVYIFLNPSFPDQIKIGRTAETSEQRAHKLSSTSGLPTPFIVVYDELVSNCEEVEKILHKRFEMYRVSLNREFFRIPIKEGIKALQEEAKRFQISSESTFYKKDVLVELKRKYGFLLKPDISSVEIVQYPDVCFLQITRRLYGHLRDELVERVDLDVIVGGDTDEDTQVSMFPLTNTVEENVRIFNELDGYTLIMTTPLFTDEGALAIAAQYEK